MAETELAVLEQANSAQQTAITTAMRPLMWKQRIEEHSSWPMLSQLRLLMTASIPLKGFKVRDLLQLKPEQVVESSWQESEDVPLSVGQVQIAWSEFEVVDQHLVVRLTRLA